MPPKKKARRNDVARGQVPPPTPPTAVQMGGKGPKNIGESVDQPIMVNSVEVTAPVFGELKPVAATIPASALGTLLDNVFIDCVPLGASVSSELKLKIWNNEFVDLKNVLPTSGDGPLSIVVQAGKMELHQAASNKTPIIIHQWTDAFLTFTLENVG
uniref:Uncharacterized protein n=1 Tax=Magallana gigas TaxID=29159 RepID=A0A8W8M0V8_MAGGI